MENNKNMQLTEEQIETIADALDEAVLGTPLEDIAKMPSNNGKLERSPEEITETGESAKVMVEVDPNSGEHRIAGAVDDSEEEETFEQMAERIQNSEIKLDETPITDEELEEYIKNKDSNGSMLTEVCGDMDLSADSIKKLLEIVNRKMNKEDFNIYKEFPDEIKQIIVNYMMAGGIPAYTNQGKQFRNMLSEQLINEFITNIGMERIKNDFNKEIEDLFKKGSDELAESVIGYTTERNQKYREYANNMEDEEKKEKVLSILDRIDEAYNLTELKEFSKRCKIKPIEFEKTNNRVYAPFLDKYTNSNFNIYDINLARPILLRNLQLENYEVTEKDIDAFFISFCKQCQNMSPENVLDHAYMYYVIYNIVLSDINKGKSIEVSKEYLANVAEVITNLRGRNKY